MGNYKKSKNYQPNKRASARVPGFVPGVVTGDAAVKALGTILNGVRLGDIPPERVFYAKFDELKMPANVQAREEGSGDTKEPRIATMTNVRNGSWDVDVDANHSGTTHFSKRVLRGLTTPMPRAKDCGDRCTPSFGVVLDRMKTIFGAWMDYGTWCNREAVTQAELGRYETALWLALECDACAQSPFMLTNVVQSYTKKRLRMSDDPRKKDEAARVLLEDGVWSTLCDKALTTPAMKERFEDIKAMRAELATAPAGIHEYTPQQLVNMGIPPRQVMELYELLDVVDYFDHFVESHVRASVEKGICEVHAEKEGLGTFDKPWSTIQLSKDSETVVRTLREIAREHSSLFCVDVVDRTDDSASLPSVRRRRCQT